MIKIETKDYILIKEGIETHLRGKKKCINCRIRWAYPYNNLCGFCLRKAKREEIFLEAERVIREFKKEKRNEHKM